MPKTPFALDDRGWVAIFLGDDPTRKDDWSSSTLGFVHGVRDPVFGRRVRGWLPSGSSLLPVVRFTGETAEGLYKAVSKAECPYFVGILPLSVSVDGSRAGHLPAPLTEPFTYESLRKGLLDSVLDSSSRFCPSH